MRQHLGELTVGKWLDILSGLGVDHKYLSRKHTECPICGGRDRFRFDNKEGRGTYYCNRCGAGDGFHFVQKYFGWDFKRAAEEIRSIIGECRKVTIKKKDPKVALRKIAHMAREIKPDSDLIQYMKNRGVYSLPDSLKEADLYYWEDGIKTGTFPTLVSLISDKYGKGVSYHLTYTHRQEKLKCSAPKKILTPVKPLEGAYVELYPVEEHIAVAEGIETALAVRDKTELPVISALNAQNLAKLDLPDVVKKVSIYGDNDASFCGHKASYALAERLVRKGVEVEVLIPPVVGEDWLDYFIRERKETFDKLKEEYPEDAANIKEIMDTFNCYNLKLEEKSE